MKFEIRVTGESEEDVIKGLMRDSTHFQVGPCLYVGTQKGSGGEGRVQSHDLSHHTLVWGISLPSSLTWSLL